jgi:ubiquinol-cytochrome c reductase subunit 7
VPYISNIITDIEAEMAEREDLEAMVITKRNKIANTASNH